jgi:dTDP-4-dehydrorhamnose reductase
VSPIFTAATTLFTGGSGLLGGAFRQLMPEALYPASAELNVADAASLDRWLADRPLSTVIHAAAFTSPPRVDQDPIRAIEANIIGTANVARASATRGLRLVYISTDYVFKGDRGRYREDDPVLPVNNYAWSKLGGECAVRLVPGSLIIRTSFGPDVFPYPKAFVDQWTSRQSVSVTAKQMIDLIGIGATGIVHLGAPRRTVMEYARALDPDRAIEPLSVQDVSFQVPVDTSLDTARFEQLMRDTDRS